ncbi:MAG: NAD(P)/FAD-dependent oxidoreductase [Lachnospiraceae bacterium]|nr:NAD(P)/FAD-dependent oxidoreductase [Lachnospiraceae bacterium]
MKKMDRYDIAIIGTGPGGLEAAITAKIRNKNIILIGNKNLSLKVEKAHTIKNYLGIPDVAGDDLTARFKKHLADMEIEITEDKISSVYAMGEYFALQGADVMYEAETVILATGVVLGKPYPGENEYLGKGVSYCATCDAPLYRGKTAAVLGFSPKEEAEAAFLGEVCEKVYYFPQYKEQVELSKENIEICMDKPKEIKGEMTVNTLVTEGGEVSVDGVFILRESVAPSQLVPGLLTEDNHVKVNRKLETSIPGCFACGDITGTPYQYIKAAGEGNVAALSAVAYLDEKKRKM